MLTHEQFQNLISLSDKDAVISDVNKLTEDEAKAALVMALLSWHKNNEINDSIINGLKGAQIK